jgi:hypothetical protein
MKVTYKATNGEVFTPVFEPAPGRLDQLIKFYKEQFHSYQIDAYKVENSWGVVVAEEGKF